MGILLCLFIVIVAIDPFVPHHDLFSRGDTNTRQTVELKTRYKGLSACSLEKNILGGLSCLPFGVPRRRVLHGRYIKKKKSPLRAQSLPTGCQGKIL